MTRNCSTKNKIFQKAYQPRLDGEERETKKSRLKEETGTGGLEKHL